MKKLLVLLAIALLPACNSTQATQGITETPIQEVKAQSNQGVNAFMEKYSKTIFSTVDKNKDGFITSDEMGVDYINKFDIDKDSKLSESEFKNFIFSTIPNFKEEKRTELVHMVYYFTKVNDIFKYSEAKKTYEGFMTKEQFTTFIDSSGIMNSFITNITKEGILSVFYIADKNNDGKLSFSEFEDCIYAFGKAEIDTATNPNKINN